MIQTKNFCLAPSISDKEEELDSLFMCYYYHLFDMVDVKVNPF